MRSEQTPHWLLTHARYPQSEINGDAPVHAVCMIRRSSSRPLETKAPRKPERSINRKTANALDLDVPSRSRAGEYQQYIGSGDQEIAGGSDPECRVDAEGNAGDNGNARSENACSAVDAPEPWRGAGADCRNQTHAGRKSEAH